MGAPLSLLWLEAQPAHVALTHTTPTDTNPTAIEKLGTSISYGRLLHEMSDTLHRAVGGGGGGGAPMPELPGLLGMLLGVGMVGLSGPKSGQNPVLSASEPFDLNSSLMLV